MTQGGSLPSAGNNEAAATIGCLNGDVYLAHKRVRSYVMLRLDSFFSDRAAVYDHSVLTVEHVLPQTVRPDSDWIRAWPDDTQREEWVHRIGNLALLSRRKNTQASNLDFEEKKEKYFCTRGGVSSFALTSKVLEQNEWTPEIVEARQTEMLGKFREGWDL